MDEGAEAVVVVVALAEAAEIEAEVAVEVVGEIGAGGEVVVAETTAGGTTAITTNTETTMTTHHADPLHLTRTTIAMTAMTMVTVGAPLPTPETTLHTHLPTGQGVAVPLPWEGQSPLQVTGETRSHHQGAATMTILLKGIRKEGVAIHLHLVLDTVLLRVQLLFNRP